MNRWIGLLLVALVASNLAWLVTRTDDVADATSGPAAPVAASAARERIDELEQRLATLTDEIAELRARPARAERPAPQPPREAAVRKAPPRVEPPDAARFRTVQKLRKEWADAALQTADPGARAAALRAIHQALIGEDPAQIEAALRVLGRLAELDYDKTFYRSLVVPMLASEDDGVRAASLYALYNTKPEPGDLATLLPLVDDSAPGVRGSLAHILVLFSDGEVEGPVADAVLKLFDDPDPQVRERTASTLWGARVAPAVEARFLAMCESPRTRHDAIYYGLSTFRDKSPAVVALLCEAMSDTNQHIAGRAQWGLGRGVPEASHGVVADAFVKLLETRGGKRNQLEYLARISSYGNTAHVAALERFAGNPLVSAEIVARVREVIEALRKRG